MQAGHKRAQVPAQIEPAAIGEPVIQQHHIGSTRWDTGQRFVDISRFPDNLHVGIALDQLTQRVTDDGVIVDEEYTEYAMHETSPPSPRRADAAHSETPQTLTVHLSWASCKAVSLRTIASASARADRASARTDRARLRSRLAHATASSGRSWPRSAAFRHRVR